MARQWLTACSVFPALATGIVFASEEPFELPRLSETVQVDGRLDEPAWQKALHIPLTVETDPGENIPAPVDTDVYLFDDGESLYIAFDAHDPEPGSIRAFVRDRDSAYDDDIVGVVLDTFNDGRRAFQFFANPFGAQMDLINDDVNNDEDDSWNAIWYSVGRLTEGGYQVEMRIPMNALRFPGADGFQTWGLDLVRIYPRSERVRISFQAKDRNRDCYLCQISTLRGIEDAEPGRNLEIVPTLTAIQADIRDDPEVDPLVGGDVDPELGLSLRWGITPNLSLNAAINPDFSQVEADRAQLDVNTQFTLFFPETRPFFLEGADFFSTPVRALNTRNVADPDVGLKLTGKVGPNVFGVFVADDAATNLVIPGSQGSDVTDIAGSNQVLVARGRRDIGSSNAGALLTWREGEDGYSNKVAGIDGRWRFNEVDSLRFQLLASQTEYPDEVIDEFGQKEGTLSDRAFRADYEHTARNWLWRLRHFNFGQDFRADMGFVTRVDYHQTAAVIGRTWYPENPDTWWTRLRLIGDWDITYDQGGQLLERETEASIRVNGPLQSFFRFEIGSRDRFFEDLFYDELYWEFYGEFQPARGVFLALGADIGDQVDFENGQLGERINLRPQIAINVGRHFRFTLRHTFENFDVDSGDLFDANLSDVRLVYQFNVRSFLRLTVQHQDIKRDPALYVDEVDARSRDLAAELLYSYKLNPQTVFFLGYNDEHIDGSAFDDSLRTGRRLFMKIGYAWQP